MSSPPCTSNMTVTFLDIETSDFKRRNSNVDLQRFNSAAPTLNNTPTTSRSPSLVRKKTASRVPTQSPSTEDIESMPRRRPLQAMSEYSNDDLDIAYTGVTMIICFFTSGLIDAVAFISWNCFASMQTGNTVFAALGLTGLPYAAHERQYFKSLVAIVSFGTGSFLFNVLHRYPTGYHNQPISRRRIVFMTSFFIQTLLIIIAAALVTVGAVSNQPFRVGQFSSGNAAQQGQIDYDHQNYKDLLPIVLLSFQAAGQVCLSRVLDVLDLPTIVLSTLYHDFSGDLLSTRHLWRQSSSIKDFIVGKARRQIKRFASIIALFLGALIGGEMYKSKAGMAGALWLAAFMKFCLTAGFALWKKHSEDDSE